MLLGAWQRCYPGDSTIIAASAVVLTAGYMLWALQRMYLGAPNPKYADTGWEINGRELFDADPARDHRADPRRVPARGPAAAEPAAHRDERSR